MLAVLLAACSTAASGNAGTSTSRATTSTVPTGTTGGSSTAPTTTTTTHPRPSTTTTTTQPGPSIFTLPGSSTKFTVYPPAPAATSLPAPTRLASFFANPLAGEGVWTPSGRRVGGQAASYTTEIQEPGSPGTVAAVIWMDPRLLSATLYSGSASPGGAPWPFTAPVSTAAAKTLAVAFNGGFKWPDSNGGYFDYGQTVYPLRDGAASFVIFTNGTASVGQWGRDFTMGPNIAAVRQNLTLLVDGGQPVPGLNPGDNSTWGSTLQGLPNQWRSAVGVTKDGALVYVVGPSLNVVQLAQLLVRAGAVRAMELDINTDWPTFATFNPVPANGLATASNGTEILPGMVGQPYRFFAAWWNRDFITMSARPTTR